MKFRTRHDRCRRLKSCCALIGATLLIATAGCSTTAPAKALAADAAPATGYLQTLDVWGDRPRVEYSKQHQLRLPAKLAVGLVGHRMHDFVGSFPGRRQVQTVKAFSADAATYKDVVSLSGTEVHGRDPNAIDQLRDLAAPHQADLLLVVRHDERVEEGHNALAVLKVLLLPMLFVPTESDELELSVHAAVVDARNGIIYTTYEGHDMRTISAAAASEDTAVREAFGEMYAPLLEEMVETLSRKLGAQADASID